MNYKNVTELKNIHKGEDIWVIAAGASMNFVNNSFLSVYSITINILLVVLFSCFYAGLVLKPDDMSDQEMIDLLEEETNKQVKWILTRKLFE